MDAPREPIRLGGLNVDFPYVPYGIQKAMLSKIGVSLTNKEHSLIESPTGTGKTLVLLCASLAWHKQSRLDKTPFISARLKKQLHTDRLEKLKSRPCSCGRRPNQPTELDELKEAKEKGGKGDTIKGKNFEYIEEDLYESACKRVRSEPKQEKIVVDSSPYFPNKSKRSEPEFIIIDSDSEDADQRTKVDSPNQENKKEIIDKDCYEIVNELDSVKKPLLSSDSNGIDPDTTITEELCKNCLAIKVEDDYIDEMGESNIRAKVSKIPRIYYGTRTHKQISQVVRELKKTSYKEDLKMCILSSRDRTCINDSVKDCSDRNDKCQELVKNRSKTNSKKSNGETCFFYRDSNAMAAEFENIYGYYKDDAFDIEDAVKFSKECGVCPYYGMRAIQEQADVTFCPYNYLLDPNIRNAMNINLNNAVIIFDEAHNIEDICRESASFVITTNDIEEILTTIIRASQNYLQGSTIGDAYNYFKNLFTDMKYFLLKYRFQHNEEQKDGDCIARRIMTHQEMLNNLESLNLGSRNLATFKENLKALRGDEDESSGKSSNASQDTALNNQQLQYIMNLSNTLSFMHGTNGKNCSDFRCLVSKHLERAKPNFKTPNRAANQGGDVHNFQFSLLCMNPGIAFEKIHSLAWSVIVASGTLSPIESLKTELGCQFKHIFEGSHVIDDDRIFASILSKGPSRVDLNCNYQSSLRLDFQDEVGQILREVCAKVPNGVLCFFPSYERMENLHQRWLAKGYIKDILASGKKMFREQKNFTPAKFEEELQKYHKFATGRGALLLAVFRGKVSEGIDFSDTAARAVITIGIPYPNVKDIAISLKREYNDNARREKPHLMTGGDWYAAQAFRALNQALGRCIRHKNDWGAIIMIDSRLTQTSSKNSISKWIRRVVSTPDDYSFVRKSLDEFVARRSLEVMEEQ